MRRCNLYWLFTLLILGISSSVFTAHVSAQEITEKKSEKITAGNVLEESKFNELLSKAAENLKSKSYRLTETIEYFPDRDGKSESVTTKILEIVLPDRKREVEEVKSPTKNTRSERIWDGKNLYAKQDDGDWKKYAGGSSMSGSITSGRTTTVYKFVGKELLDNKKADVYEVESRRVANKMTQTSVYRVEYVTKTKYWLGENGSHLKTVTEYEIVGSKALSREIAIYDYDSNIKIEAPIQ